MILRLKQLQRVAHIGQLHILTTSPGKDPYTVLIPAISEITVKLISSLVFKLCKHEKTDCPSIYFTIASPALKKVMHI